MNLADRAPFLSMCSVALALGIGPSMGCVVEAGDDGGSGAASTGDTSTDGDGGDGDVSGAGESAGEVTGGQEMGDDGGAPSPCDDGVPDDAATLLPWLENGDYLGFMAESAVHDSAGPHFGDVRTYVGDCLATSLEDGGAQHPVGAAAVKELYGSGGTVQGWAVMVKAEPASGGDGWYWYEWYNGSVYGGSVDDSTCRGCHASGIDGVRSPWPLQ